MTGGACAWSAAGPSSAVWSLDPAHPVGAIDARAIHAAAARDPLAPAVCRPQPVGAGATGKHVDAATAGQDVAAAVPLQAIGAATPEEDIGAVSAAQAVRPVAAVEPIIAAPA